MNTLRDIATEILESPITEYYTECGNFTCSELSDHKVVLVMNCEAEVTIDDALGHLLRIVAILKSARRHNLTLPEILKRIEGLTPGEHNVH